MSEEFEVGVVDSRTLEEQLSVLNSSLDLYEIVMMTEYTLKKYSDNSDEPVTEDEVPAEELDENEFDIASVDITLNLNTDYFRVIRIDKGRTFKYSIICQVNFDNIVHTKDYLERQPLLDALTDRIKAIGTGTASQKSAESNYLVGGGKF